MQSAQRNQLLAISHATFQALAKLRELPSGSSDVAVHQALIGVERAKTVLQASLATLALQLAECLLSATRAATVFDLGKQQILDGVPVQFAVLRGAEILNLESIDGPHAPLSMRLELAWHAPGNSGHGRVFLESYQEGDEFFPQSNQP